MEQFETGGREFLDDVLNRKLAFMRGIPNTVQYWQDRRKELFAMIRQLGKPHAFLTLSAAELHWKRLLETLERLHVGPDCVARVIDQLDCMQRVELVNNDPVACAIYTHRIFDVILNVLKDKRCSPFKPYVVVDFFKRVEFQQRGSAHVHTILWSDNAPDEEELSADMPRTLEMVESLLTLDRDLLKRPRTQMHAHTHTCYKRGRTKCRFGAPFMPSNETRIVLPFPPTEGAAENARRQQLRKRYEDMHDALKRGEFASLEEFLGTFNVHSDKEYMDILKAGFARPCVLHKRTPAQKFVNAFNPWIAKVLDSNMDLQIILDYYACATYVVDYVNKADRGMSNLCKAVQQILENPNMEYAAVVRSIGVNMLRGVEMSAQEAAWFLLRQEMSQKSRDVVYIPTCYPEECVQVRKTNEELAKLSASSADVWKLNLIQKYEARQRELDDVCLADFASTGAAAAMAMSSATAR